MEIMGFDSQKLYQILYVFALCFGYMLFLLNV